MVPPPPRLPPPAAGSPGLAPSDEPPGAPGSRAAPAIRRRRGDVALLLALLVGLGAASVPGALRAARLDEPPRLTVRPFRIDVNRATPDELSALPGVGPSLASRMADERIRAPFRAADDLRRVTGIGPSLVSRIGPHADFEPEPRRR